MKDSKGNALFLVLMGVALFAALGYAVTQTGRGGIDVSKETQLAGVSKVAQIIGDVRNAINRLTLGGCDLTEVSFYSTQYAVPSDYNNTNSPVAGGDFSCHLFHNDGGQLVYFGEDLDDLICVNGACGTTLMHVTGEVAIQGVGSAKPELMYFVDNTSKEFCELINSKVGISSTIPTDSANPDDSDKWQGTFDDASPMIVGDSDANLEGRSMGCYKMGSEYVFFAVLRRR